jgi:hypothetical protein
MKANKQFMHVFYTVSILWQCLHFYVSKTLHNVANVHAKFFFMSVASEWKMAHEQDAKEQGCKNACGSSHEQHNHPAQYVQKVCTPKVSHTHSPIFYCEHVTVHIRLILLCQESLAFLSLASCIFLFHVIM